MAENRPTNNCGGGGRIAHRRCRDDCRCLRGARFIVVSRTITSRAGPGLRVEMVNRAAGKLADSMSEAADVLQSLLTSKSESVGFRGRLADCACRPCRVERLTYSSGSPTLSRRAVEGVKWLGLVRSVAWTQPPRGCRTSPRTASILLLMRDAGLIPDLWQVNILGQIPQRHSCCKRQVGKSTATAFKAIEAALLTPGNTVLIISPSLRQSGEMLRKVLSGSTRYVVP